jgi:20S proteasome alpha/beta subunit
MADEAGENLMTLVIAAHGTDFVVLGADSRATVESGGTRVEINIMEKITPMTKHVAILLSGEAEVGDRLVEKFKLSLRRQDDGATLIAERLTEFCREDARQLAGVPTHPSYFPNFGFIIAGLDKRGSKYRVPRCYRLDSLSGFRLGLSRGFAVDGKPMIARYLFAKNFQWGMQLDELCRLVAQAMFDTMSIDGDVGGKIRMGRIDPTGYTEIPETDIKNEYITSWDVERLRRIVEQ